MLGTRLSRRRLLGNVTGAVALTILAGCSDRNDGGDPDGDADASDGTDAADAEQGDNELDLREANVVDVAVDGGDGTYTFDVTLHHDDDGEDGYANWWQVERLEGTQLGRRDLRHAHSQQPFTRSATIEIPDDVTCVLVRGHDRTHGYGGRAMVVSLESGASRSVDQGSEPHSIDETGCP